MSAQHRIATTTGTSSSRSAVATALLTAGCLVALSWQPFAGANAAAAASACAGDCSGSGAVAITDIITLVNIVLGAAAPSACANGIPAGNTVDIGLLIQAVNAALNGCVASQATATPAAATPTPSPIACPAAPASATPTVTPMPVGGPMTFRGTITATLDCAMAQNCAGASCGTASFMATVCFTGPVGGAYGGTCHIVQSAFSNTSQACTLFSNALLSLSQAGGHAALGPNGVLSGEQGACEGDLFFYDVTMSTGALSGNWFVANAPIIPLALASGTFQFSAGNGPCP